MKDEIEKIYLKDAQEQIDMFFDNGYFAPEVKRKDMRSMEEYLAWIIQSRVNSALRAKELIRRFKKL